MQEVRLIGFNERELVEALVTLMRRRREPLPSGEVAEVKLRESPLGVSVLVRDRDGRLSAIRKDGAYLGAAMIAYCLERNVPLPARAHKSIEVIAGEAHLVIQLADADMALPTEPDQRAA